MLINSCDISVVVQGPIAGRPDDKLGSLTRRCLDSVRRHLPDAEIILSTYNNSPVDGLPFDIVVQSEDPGGHIQNDSLGVWNNSNRQIVTTMAGLSKASRPFVVKYRTDVLMTGSGWTKYFGRFQKRANEWHICDERLLACTIYSRNPASPYCFPLHPSDWFFFGYRNDVTKLWDIPLQPEPETSRYFESRPRPTPDVISTNLMRYTPEQYLWVSFLRKYGPVEFQHCHDFTQDAVALTELTIANNLVLLEPHQIQMKFLKYRISQRDLSTVYTHGDWLRMYKKYCDSSMRVGPDFTKLLRAIGAYV